MSSPSLHPKYMNIAAGVVKYSACQNVSSWNLSHINNVVCFIYDSVCYYHTPMQMYSWVPENSVETKNSLGAPCNGVATKVIRQVIVKNRYYMFLRKQCPQVPLASSNVTDNDCNIKKHHFKNKKLIYCNLFFLPLSVLFQHHPNVDLPFSGCPYSCPTFKNYNYYFVNKDTHQAVKSELPV